MTIPDPHLSDQDLLLAADGELPRDEAAKVQAHLECCWTCRTRMNEIESTISDFIHARSAANAPLPPADGSRALLKLRLAQLAESTPFTLWERIAAGSQSRSVALVSSVCFGLLIGIIAWRSVKIAADSAPPMVDARGAIPDPQLTPGATLPLTKDDICAAGMVDAARVVPANVAKTVFAAYGVGTPEPRAYEVDYLITPALGGSDSIRNFWPQPYGNTVWNAHIKDALEDRMRQLVCDGKLDLRTAQREIAQNWIAAYKKYFHTQLPLSEHASFLKDRPWE